MQTVVIAMLVLLLGPARAFAQTERSPLVFLVSSGEYFGESYAERPAPGASFVFFQGEPIKLRLTIVCRDTDEELLLPSLVPSAIFPVLVHRDGQPSSAPLKFGEVNFYGLDGRATVTTVTRQVRLNPGEQIEWSAELSSGIEPGLYRFSFEIRASDGHSRSVVPHVSALAFEVRARTQASQAEILRREALRDVVRDDNERLERAEASINALLRINPNSVEAHLIRRRIAVARGSPSMARSHSLRAQEILEQEQDTMLRQFKTPEQLIEIRKGVAILNMPK